MTGRAHRRVTLAGSVVGAVLVALDGTVLTIAQPALQHDLGASLTQVQWTSTGYLIAVASLLVFAGRLGDRFGHRRLFGYGTLGFAAASAGIGCAPGIGAVIALRVVQGVCGALLQPATLGMLRAAYPPDELGMPIALRTSAIGVAAATGPLVGGVLTAHLGWRSAFFLSVLPAVAIAVLVLCAPDPGEHTERRTRNLDGGGALLLGAALACLVAVLVTLPGAGWSQVTVAALVGACAATAAFVVHERRVPDPLLSPALLASPAVAAGLGVLLTASAAFMGTLFVATYFLQDVLALDALGTALRMLPAALCMVLAAPLCPMLLRRLGTRPVASAATLLLAAGVFAFGRLDTTARGWQVAACAVAMGIGFGAVMVAATEVVVRRAAVADAGVAGGLQQTAMNIGPVLGVATATTLLASGSDVATSMGTTLTVLAAAACLGTVAALKLPHGERTAVREAAH
ncbi:MFS transporter [Streptomyces sp. VRA16 Mangrove soil]|uniref:MFS transporter n=1 Tax=Streptomyces sp. VRA16 Mangrove soil TaxID=2817434 RepID=UPI001A9E4BE3|nr:MFS transporter [Streptomyces sp. VRA16 Mangrove soil]MBO1330331.1 MFS transporter [Streptomyces sp. VRA16 Mangrove soil]